MTPVEKYREAERQVAHAELLLEDKKRRLDQAWLRLTPKEQADALRPGPVAEGRAS